MDADAALQKAKAMKGRGPGNQDLNIEECGGEDGREPLRYWEIPLTPDHSWRGILMSFWPDC